MDDVITNGGRTPVHHLRILSYCFCAAGLMSATLLLPVDPLLALLPVSFLFGWTQVASPCGMNLVAALTSTATDYKKWGQWAAAASLFTISGLVSSVGVGFGLGWIGKAVSLYLSSRDAWICVTLVAAVLAARERGLLNFQLLELRRPSFGEWRRFGFLSSASMWGFHIGLGFSTYVNYGGFYVLASMILLGLGGDNSRAFGASLMGIYWAGRACSVWVAPLRAPHNRSAVGLLMKEIYSEFPLQRRIHGLGLTCVAVFGLLRIIAAKLL